MEAHAEQLKDQSSQLRLQPREMPERRLALVGTVCGVIGGLMMALPLVLYDWARSATLRSSCRWR